MVTDDDGTKESPKPELFPTITLKAPPKMRKMNRKERRYRDVLNRKALNKAKKEHLSSPYHGRYECSECHRVHQCKCTIPKPNYVMLCMDCEKKREEDSE